MKTYEIIVRQFDTDGQIVGSVSRTATEDNDESIIFGKEAPYTLENEAHSAIDLIVDCDHVLIKLLESF